MVRAAPAARLRLRRLTLAGLPLTLLDVFTDTPLTGNGLAVVHGADGLDDATMLALTREMRLSETSFLQFPRASRADYRHRIWMPGGEIPFAGHPSLGAAVAVARERGAAGSLRFVQETAAGLHTVAVELSGDRAYASMMQGPVQLGPEVDPARVLPALGLAPGLAAPGLPPQVASAGVAHLLVPVAEPDALAGIDVDRAALRALLGGLGALCAYVAWCGEPGAARARSFTSDDAVPEDPATGSAAGPLCAYLAARGRDGALTISQGAEMGRPSRLDTTVEGDRVRVGGEVVVVLEGTLRLQPDIR